MQTKIMTKRYETMIGLILILLSISLYRFPSTYGVADVLSIVATIVCGRDMVIGAIKGVIRGKLNVAELITIAIIASLAIGEYLVAAEVAFIMTAGGYLEERVIDRSRRAINALISLIPSQARLMVDGEEKMLPLSQVTTGVVVMVKPGEEIPVDGMVLTGTSLVNEASITGESKPINKSPGITVYAGSMNIDGALEIKTQKAGNESVLGRMVELTQKSLNEKTPVIRLADRFAAWFTPLVLALTFLVFVLTGDLVRSIAVLVVMCPCTLVLAIPTAHVASLGKLVKNGILLKGGIYLEKAAEVDTIILDKTGTVTLGRPTIAKIIPLEGITSDELLSLAASVEKYSTHPIAQAIVTEARSKAIHIPDFDNVTLLPGCGMMARAMGRDVVVGNARYLKKSGHRRAQAALSIALTQEAKGRTTFFVALNKVVQGVIALDDPIRAETVQGLTELKTMIPNLYLLTGDNQNAAYQVAYALGIREYRSQLLPEEKVNVLAELKTQGRTVAAVGDGVNDALLLASADVGIAMGDSAAAITIDAGSVVLLNGDFSKLPLFFSIARRARAIIKQNIIVFAVCYNLLALFLASFGYLTPLGGAIVHNVGSTLVVLNSMRLLK